MARFLHSVFMPERTVVAGEVVTVDLPVNPLSHLWLDFGFLNVTDKATPAEVLAAIARVEVLFKGSAVVACSGADLVACGQMGWGYQPCPPNYVVADNAVRNLLLLVPFGRRLYGAGECFPASVRGSLQLRISMAAAITALDNLTLLGESVELPEASPKQFTKLTTLVATPAAVGDMDVELPIGNRIARLFGWQTTVPAEAVATRTVNSVRLLLDNVAQWYTHSMWDVFHQASFRRVALTAPWSYHGHILVVADVLEPITAAARCENNYWMLDFDPNDDDAYLLETEGHAAVVLRVNAGDTNPLRVLPLELVSGAGG